MPTSSSLPHEPRTATGFATDGDVLRALLVRAGDTLLAHFDPATPITASAKADGSPVTAADLASERTILAGLRAAWPGDTLVSEEGGGGTEDTRAPARWFIDPLDGTSAFLEGLAHWGPTAARVDAEGRVLVGGTWLPRLREGWWVEEGVAWHQDRRLPRLGAPPSVLLVPSALHRDATLRWPGKARCLGGTAAHLALVARGAAAAVIVGRGWSPWDVATGLALIDAVGGSARSLDGGRPTLGRGSEARWGAPFVAGAPEVVASLVHGGLRFVEGGQDAAG